MQKILGIIPARYASTRFPAKPLVDIKGKPMIQWVYENAAKCTDLMAVVVATDDERIFNTVKGFGGQVVYTSPDHYSGSDRCAEAYLNIGLEADYVINIQGDEPFIDPIQISTLASILDGKTEIATLVKKFTDAQLLFSPHSVKVALNKHWEAMLFSRSVIPHNRNKPQEEWLSNHTYWKHLGIYAYRTDILKELNQLAVGNLEKAESLEQLRWLEAGYKIKVAETEIETIAIDTPEDLERLLNSI